MATNKSSEVKKDLPLARKGDESPQDLNKQKKKQEKPKEVGRGIVKKVSSGDKLVIYLDPQGKAPPKTPPDEQEIKLSGIKAPLPYAKWIQGEREEEAWAWHSKDFLRRLCVGRPVEFTIEHTAASRCYGSVRLLKPAENEEPDLAKAVVAAGWATVSLPKDDTSAKSDKIAETRPELKAFLDLQAEAKEKGKGLHTRDAKLIAQSKVQFEKPSKSLPNERAQIENGEEEESEGVSAGEVFFDATEMYKSCKGKTLEGIVELVQSGSTLRILLQPSFREVLVKISGVQSPVRRAVPGDEPYAVEAKFTTERYILQRDVKVIFNAFEQKRANDPKGEPTFHGEVFYKDKSIGELLLSSGLARFVEWSAPPEKVDLLKSLQEKAQHAHLRIWSSDQAVQSARGSQKTQSTFSGKVVEVNTGNSIVVLNQDVNPPCLVPVTLSSINVNRLGHGEREDGFFAWEAREFVRKRLIGRRVQVTVDYVKPAVNIDETKAKQSTQTKEGPGKKNNNDKKEDKILPPKAFHTVLYEGKNIALGLVEAGFAEVIEHRGQERSPHYDALFLAQERARTHKLGLHGNPENFTKHYTHDLSRSAPAAKRLFKSLETREGQTHKAIVEYVISGGRLKLCIPAHSCIVTFFLAGARCNSVPNRQQLEGGKAEVSPMAIEARDFTKNLILHHDVEVAIDGQDNSGAFRGYLWFKKKDLALLLLEKGLAYFNRIGRSAQTKDLEERYFDTEAKAKEQRIGLWKDYDPAAELELLKKQNEELEALAKPQKEVITVTEVMDGTCCYFQVIGEEHKALEALMAKLAAAGLDAQPPHTSPQRGEAVAVKFSGDGFWYRGVVTGTSPNGFKVLYADYGNMETVNAASIRKLSPELGPDALKWQALEGHLAYIQARPVTDEWGKEAALAFKELVWGKTLLATVEYRDGPKLYLTLIPSDDKDIFVNGELVRAGLAKVQKRIPRGANQEIIGWLRNEQDNAHRNHRGIWEYGDDGEEDETEDRREFGRTGRPTNKAK